MLCSGHEFGPLLSSRRYVRNYLLREFLLWLNRLRTQCYFCEDVGWSLALLSVLRIWRCHRLWCRSQMWLRSDVAVALVQAGSCSSNSSPYAVVVAIRRKKRKKEKKKQLPEVPVLEQQKWILLGTMRFQVQSLALLSGLRISSVTMSCGVGCTCSSDPALLWLWCRLAAVVPIRPLAWEPPYAAGVALKSKKVK